MASITIRVPSGEIENARDNSGGAYVTPAGKGTVNRTRRAAGSGCVRSSANGDRCECGGDNPRNSQPPATESITGRGCSDRNTLRGFRHVIAQLRQIACQISSRGIPLVRILGETSLDHPAHGDWELRDQRLDWLRVVTDDRSERFRARVA